MKAALRSSALVRAVTDAAGRWADADFPPRVRITGAIASRTGYSTPVVEYALDRLFVPLDAATLESVLAEELGGLEALEGFVPRAGGIRARAYPVGRVAIVSSETTIGVALAPAVFALCAGCSVLVKDREDALIGAFFATLAEEYPELRAVARAEHWTGGDASPSDQALRFADAVVAFGRDATLAEIRGLLRPGARFVGYGHRATIGYLARGSLDDEASARRAARGAARDLVLYDGEGCMSLHALFVERGATIDAERFAATLIEEVETAAVEFPIVRIDPRISPYLAGVAFRSALGAGGPRVFRTSGGDATLVVDPPHRHAPPFLPRVLPIYTVEGPSECEEYVRSHGLPLEAFGTGDVDDAMRALGAALGAVRIARFGELQAPSPSLPHGGRARVSDFVRWVASD
ncbi:MAG: hypothetical protein JO359_07270 [Candidatus Eremiobacteraeota bacterium]|nr:hypothetical protein [Candidatus Eremiobacteraeota bacterium]